jgi:hypothetical protein
MHDSMAPRSTTAGSIREPGATARGPRSVATPVSSPARVVAGAVTGARGGAPNGSSGMREPRSRPNPNPLRLMLGLAGLASAAAFTTAMLPSVATQPEPPASDPAVAAAAVQPDPSVKHVTRYVTLQPGQTAPPQSTVVIRPKPTPRVTVKVVTRTRQSGKP